jgi:hypothetical protein
MCGYNFDPMDIELVPKGEGCLDLAGVRRLWLSEHGIYLLTSLNKGPNDHERNCFENGVHQARYL